MLVDLWCPVAYEPHLLLGHVVPLVATGKSLGVLALGFTGHARTFDAETLAIAIDLSARASIALDNAVLFPHVGSATAETRKAMGDLQIESLQRHFAGQPVLTKVA